MTNKGKMTLINSNEGKDLNKFLGVEEKEEKIKPWKMILTFSKAEEEAIKKSFDESTYKAMYRFLIDAVIQNKEFVKYPVEKIDLK